MRRRDFVMLLEAAAPWPLTAHAQQAKQQRRIGVLLGLPRMIPKGRPVSVHSCKYCNSWVGSTGAIFKSSVALPTVTPTVHASPRGGRSPHWIKVKNRQHHAFDRVRESFA
jgi:hypothetical protein